MASVPAWQPAVAAWFSNVVVHRVGPSCQPDFSSGPLSVTGQQKGRISIQEDPILQVSNPGLSYSFDKRLRLLKAADFQPVFKQARFKVSSQTVLVLAIENNLRFPRLGLVIAKKNIARAVQRNRVKRLLRESFRLNQHLLAGLDIVILARSGLGSLENPEITGQIETLWQDLMGKYHKSRRKSDKAD